MLLFTIKKFLLTYVWTFKEGLYALHVYLLKLIKFLTQAREDDKEVACQSNASEKANFL